MDQWQETDNNNTYEYLSARAGTGLGVSLRNLKISDTPSLLPRYHQYLLMDQ